MRILQILTVLLFITTVACSPKVTKVTEVAEVAEVVENSMEEKEVDVHEFRKSAPSPGPAPKINIAEANTWELDNGLKIILVENHKIPQVSFQLRLLHDPIRESKKVGKVSMTADIMTRGTTTKTKAEIDEAIDFLGANIFSTSNGIFASSLTKHQEELLNVMTDILYNPSFPEEELEKIKTQTLSGLESSKTDPNAIANNVLAKVTYGDQHPYGEIQTPDHVAAISVEDLKAYHRAYYTPTNAYLIIIGDITEKQVSTLTSKHFSKWKGSTIKPARRRTVKTSKNRQISFAHKEGAVQSVVMVSNPVDLKPGDPDAIPASVMNALLGGGISSRLNQNLREDKAYTYGANSSLRPDVLTGTFSASASMRSEVTDSSIVEFLHELQRIRTEPVGEQELQSMKNFMTGGFARALESPRTIARFAYNIAKYELPTDYYQTYLERLNAVTSDDIITVAKKYLHPDQANIIVVGNKDEVADKLKTFDADGEITFFDAFANELVVSDIPVPANVTANTIIEDYIHVLGGSDKLSTLKTLYTKMTTNAMGQSMTIESFHEDDTKYAMRLGNGQMVFQEQKFDGDKAGMSAMGQTKTFTEGPEYNQMKSGARVVPQRYYGQEGALLDLKGIEKVGEDNAYKIIVTNPDGSSSSEFYSVASSFLIRTTTTQDGPQGKMTIQTDYQDYYDAGDGIMFPKVTSVVGLLPNGAAMVMEVAEIKMNDVFEAGTFTFD